VVDAERVAVAGEEEDVAAAAVGAVDEFGQLHWSGCFHIVLRGYT
jgi:hypothetical protein